MTNPIHKRPRSATTWSGWTKMAPKWYAVCPECKENVEIGQYDTATRKTAKDSLYRHRRKRHTPPRSG